MIDILVYLFSRFDDFASQPEPVVLARKLRAAGFDEGEISEAIRCLDALGPDAAGSPRRAAAAGSTRIWTAEERQKLEPESLGFLTFLGDSGVLAPDVRELIVDRALAFDDTPVPLAVIKVLVLMALWRREYALETLLIEELLTGPDRVTH